MATPRIYCDEDVNGAVMRALERMGIETSSVVADRRMGQSDEQHIVFATMAGYAILTHNVDDFPRLHTELISRGEQHRGIIMSRQDLSVGEIVRRVAHLCSTLSAEEMRNRIEYLSSW